MKKIDLKKCFKLFNNYVKDFNLKDKETIEKFHHTYRVMEYAKQISISENLIEEDVDIACLCALLHDIGRFEQWDKYHTFLTRDSVDHCLLGFEILKKDNYIDQYIKDEEIKKIILNSTINHGKLKIDESLTQKEALFCKIVRDADKIDIMLEQGNIIRQNDLLIKEILINSLFENKMCIDNHIESDVDYILRSFGFIFDFNFKYTFKFIKEKEVINRKIELLKIYVNNDKLDKLKCHLNNYIEGEIKC